MVKFIEQNKQIYLQNHHPHPIASQSPSPLKGEGVTSLDKNYWKLLYNKKILSEIKGMNILSLERIHRALIDLLAKNIINYSKIIPYSLYSYRTFRVGDYRILFSLRVDDEIIVVHKIAHRREVYER